MKKHDLHFAVGAPYRWFRHSLFLSFTLSLSSRFHLTQQRQEYFQQIVSIYVRLRVKMLYGASYNIGRFHSQPYIYNRE